MAQTPFNSNDIDPAQLQTAHEGWASFNRLSRYAIVGVILILVILAAI
ncbi:MAG: aa3-type cytochrome c oxidase subunit IV [Pseudomonadota bacterium]